ncbi:MAG: hypothetical protein RSC41_04045 [Oscillospiraceae bacterium]
MMKFEMKKFALPVAIFLLVFSLAGCGAKQKFKATVTDVGENSITVVPFDGEDELNSADLINVSFNKKTNLSEKSIKINDAVEITYDGFIAESYPAQIFDCSKIVILE